MPGLSIEMNIRQLQEYHKEVQSEMAGMVRAVASDQANCFSSPPTPATDSQRKIANLLPRSTPTAIGSMARAVREAVGRWVA